MENTYTMGWYGTPWVGGERSRVSKTHLRINGRLACGTVFGRDMEFQWCVTGIRALKFYDIECIKCSKRAKAIAKEIGYGL